MLALRSSYLPLEIFHLQLLYSDHHISYRKLNHRWAESQTADQDSTRPMMTKIRHHIPTVSGNVATC